MKREAWVLAGAEWSICEVVEARTRIRSYVLYSTSAHLGCTTVLQVSILTHC
jgi:hypothetical protein